MALEFRIERFEEVESTNLGIMRALETGEPEGLVWRARVQTGGYGRQGRTWSSPEGGLYQSLLVRPSVALAQLPTLGLIVALAVRSTLMRLCGLDEKIVQVKWPNDVVCAAGKLSGISTEAHAGGVCIGVGVNVFRPMQDAAVGGKNVPAYAEDLGSINFGIDDLGDELLADFAARYEQWQHEGFAAFVDEFRACSALAGREVEIVTLNGMQLAAGYVEGIDDEGRLLVATARGIQVVSSGEAHIVGAGD